MSQLSAINLPENIRIFDYNRGDISSGIVHFGIGNFHRSHQAVYCDDLLSRGDMQWGITGVSLRSGAMRDALEPQDYLYTLAILGEATEYRIIGAIQDIVVGPEDPMSVVSLIANSSTKLISSTITEKGYYLASSKVDFDHPDLQAELESLNTPKTIYGFLARGLMVRAKLNPQSKLTIMCCDNISKGGEFLKLGVCHLLQHHSPETLKWAETHVGFVSSMVDRVCPATNEKLRQSVGHDTGCDDAWPVSAEPYSQWIIEGDFIGERPNFDRVGAVFVDDIAPFERMKLSYLNAAHTIASTLGYLSGDIFVHEAIQRDEVLHFMRLALINDILPYAAVPDGYDGLSYIESVIERFKNGNLPYANLQVGTDSSQKIQQRWFPIIDIALADNAKVPYFEFAIGAWVVFIQRALENGVLNDPKKNKFMEVKANMMSERVSAYLKIASADEFAWSRNPDFMRGVKAHASTIEVDGIITALKNFRLSQKQKEKSHA